MRKLRNVRPAVGQPTRWDDLEVFGTIALGIRAGKTLQQIAEDPLSGAGGARMLYFRLARLERALGRRLVDRRPWGRSSYLTEVGAAVAGKVTELRILRQQVDEVARGTDIPLLRIVTHATLASALIPAVVRRRRVTSGSPDFHLELVVVDTYAHALAAVNEGRADIGLYLAFREFDRARTPRGVRREILGETEVVVLCPLWHRFVTRTRSHTRPVLLAELAAEPVIARGYVDLQLLLTSARGRRIIVPNSTDKLAYVRLGLGVSILPKLIADLAGRAESVVLLPFRPVLRPVLCLLRPKKRLRSFPDAMEEFLDDVKVACRSALRSSARSPRRVTGIA